jgi:hypothetical protein
MKEDILEQLVDDYLQPNGFFTTHNVKFQQAKGDPDYIVAQDCVPSDVDAVGFHPLRPLRPLRKGPDRVWVVSCKSWQGGFNPGEWIISIEKNKRVSGREAWHWFRELVKKKWADALITKIEKLTGSIEFTYVTAVTKLRGGPSGWQHPPFEAESSGKPDRYPHSAGNLDAHVQSDKYDRGRFANWPAPAGDQSLWLETIAA